MFHTLRQYKRIAIVAIHDNYVSPIGKDREMKPETILIILVFGVGIVIFLSVPLYRQTADEGKRVAATASDALPEVVDRNNTVILSAMVEEFVENGGIVIIAKEEPNLPGYGRRGKLTRGSLPRGVNLYMAIK